LVALVVLVLGANARWFYTFICGDFTPLQQPLQVSLSMAVAVVPGVACRDNCDASPRNAADGATQCPDPQAASSGDRALSPPSVRIRRHPHPEQDGGSGGSHPVQPMKSVAMATCQRASFANRQTVRLLNPKQIQSCMACRLHRCNAVLKSELQIYGQCGRPPKVPCFPWLVKRGWTSLRSSSICPVWASFSSERKRMSVICRVKPGCNLPIPEDTSYWIPGFIRVGFGSLRPDSGGYEIPLTQSSGQLLLGK